MTLTDEEIRIKVAEEMGWTVVQDEHGVCGTIDGIHWHSPAGFPNYPESLDACAEFEKTLTDAEWDAYSAEIVSLTLWDRATDTVKRILQATARQRCLAYLKVKGILP